MPPLNWDLVELVFLFQEPEAEADEAETQQRPGYLRQTGPMIAAREKDM